MMADENHAKLRAPVYVLGNYESGFIVRDDGCIPVWTAEAHIVRFIEGHTDLLWIPLDYTEIRDDLALLTNLRRLRGKGAHTIVIDPEDVDDTSPRALDLDSVIAALSACVLPA
jgi:hypothetical protein